MVGVGGTRDVRGSANCPWPSEVGMGVMRVGRYVIYLIAKERRRRERTREDRTRGVRLIPP